MRKVDDGMMEVTEQRCVMAELLLTLYRVVCLVNAGDSTAYLILPADCQDDDDDNVVMGKLPPKCHIEPLWSSEGCI